MGIFEALIGAVLAFFAGSFTTKVTINNENDRDRCNIVIDAIDRIVGSFHSRFNNSPSAHLVNDTLFDYQIRGLVDDTTLLPIIGRKVFEEEYTKTIAKMYTLTLDSPLEISPEKKDELLEAMNSNAIDLKKIINSNRQSWRLVRRK